ncbi:MAG: alpha/beta fold hydrolase, partial [Pseudomonadota bacterium]
GWPRFNLVAHSLGACIAPFVAAVAPERVTRLIMLDGIGPPTETPDALPTRLKRSVQSTIESRQRLTRIYARVEDAVSARLAATKMARTSAELVVRRSLKETEGGFTWRFDPKIRLPSPSYLSEAQVQACFDAVRCPALLVLAEAGVPHVRDHAEARLAWLQRGVMHRVSGDHHVHMDDPEPVAAALRKFILHSGA